MLLSRFILVLLLVIAPVKVWATSDALTTPSADTVAEPVETLVPEQVEQQEQHEAHESGGLPQLNVKTYPSQIFWLAVMFIVLYLTFSRTTLPSIGNVLNAREAMIQGNLDTAQDLKNQAEEIQNAYEKSLEKSRAEASKAVMDVELTAKKKAADQMEVFRRKADTEIKTTEERVLAAKDKVMGDMASVAAEVASVAAEKITGIGTDMQKARAIVDSIASKAKAA